MLELQLELAGKLSVVETSVGTLSWKLLVEVVVEVSTMEIPIVEVTVKFAVEVSRRNSFAGKLSVGTSVETSVNWNFRWNSSWIFSM